MWQQMVGNLEIKWEEDERVQGSSHCLCMCESAGMGPCTSGRVQLCHRPCQETWMRPDTQRQWHRDLGLAAAPACTWGQIEAKSTHL